MSKKNDRKLSSFLINKRLQLGMMGIFTFLTTLAFASYSFVLVMFFEKFKNMGFAAGFDESSVFFRFLLKQQDFLLYSFMGTFFVTMFLFVLIGLKFSHRISGPMYKFNEHLKEMVEKETAKELHPVNFRKNDYFEEVGVNFNKLVRKINDEKTPAKKVG